MGGAGSNPEVEAMEAPETTTAGESMVLCSAWLTFVWSLAGGLVNID